MSKKNRARMVSAKRARRQKRLKNRRKTILQHDTYNHKPIEISAEKTSMIPDGFYDYGDNSGRHFLLLPKDKLPQVARFLEGKNYTISSQDVRKIMEMIGAE